MMKNPHQKLIEDLDLQTFMGGITHVDLPTVHRLAKLCQRASAALKTWPRVAARDLDDVERVAKALWDSEPVIFSWGPQERREVTWEDAVKGDLAGARIFRQLARAAIDAMPEDAGDGYSAGECMRMIEETTGISPDLLGIPADAIVNVTVSGTPTGACDHTINRGDVGWKVRQGSRVAMWSPAGMPVGLIEVHPDHPPRLHRFCGCTEELTVNDGAVMMTIYADPMGQFDMDIGSIQDWPRERPKLSMQELDAALAERIPQYRRMNPLGTPRAAMDNIKVLPSQKAVDKMHSRFFDAVQRTQPTTEADASFDCPHCGERIPLTMTATAAGDEGDDR